MSKTLFYVRHGLKDGSIIGEFGMDGACHFGLKAGQEGPRITRIFFGLVYRTCQTALAFLRGLATATACKGPNGPALPRIQQPVVEIGTEGLFTKIVDDRWKQASAAGASNFEATLKAHPRERVEEWAQTALDGVTKMFNEMGEGETGIAFGHSPVIELAVWASVGFQVHPFVEYMLKPKELQGVAFVQENGKISAVSKMGSE